MPLLLGLKYFIYLNADQRFGLSIDGHPCPQRIQNVVDQLTISNSIKNYLQCTKLKKKNLWKLQLILVKDHISFSARGGPKLSAQQLYLISYCLYVYLAGPYSWDVSWPGRAGCPPQCPGSPGTQSSPGPPSHPPPPPHPPATRTRSPSSSPPVFRIRISFYADPNPGSQKCPYRTDPDPIADPDPRGINTEEEKFHQKLFN